MRNPRFAVLFAYAAVIAACSATMDTPPSAPTPPDTTVPAVPTTPAAPPAPISAAAAEPATPTPAKTLKSAMKGIEEDWKAIENALAPNASADLKALAGAAERVAAVMKLAYDPWEDKEVPNFAKLAHEAEDAFRSFAQKAKAGDAAAVQELGKTLQSQHCARCHDAVEQVHG